MTIGSSVKVKVKTSYGLVDAVADQRRMLLGKEHVRIVFNPDNAQWMQADSEYLVWEPEEEKKIKHLHWYGGHKGL